MGLRDDQSVPEDRRVDEILRWLEGDENLEPFRDRHEILLYRFGESSLPEPFQVLPRFPPEAAPSAVESAEALPPHLNASLSGSRIVGWVAISILTIAALGFLAGGISYFILRKTVFARGLFAAAVFTSVWSLIVFAWADLLSPSQDLFASLGWRKPILSEPADGNSGLETEKQSLDLDPVDWELELNPRGTATQLGAALQAIINQERGGPIAGVILVTDGCHNTGIPPTRVIAAAQNVGIPIFPIGLGTTTVQMNVEVANVQAPSRVFPEDKFKIKALIKSFGFQNLTVPVQLISVDENRSEAETIEAEQLVRLGEEGVAVPIEFNVSQTELGKRTYVVRTTRLPGELDVNDNEQSDLVEVVDRQTQVLIIAGGPMREFRFLRNQLYRDKDILLHVWLQSSKEGADQESDLLLLEFPQSREELFEYDCIVAFDPDWRELTKEQADLLERWVAEQAGGLILVAGPVNTPEWTRRPRGDETMDKIRALYPVSFYSQGSAQLKLGRFGGSDPFPLDFSREGRAAEFLWIGDSALESQSTWERFEGVFGYYAVNEPKPGADVLANFADPSTSVDERLPIYLASQFYGAGRVFFQASGEMWRVRKLDVGYFQEYYTKLVRWASQGRLLRDSTRGVLLTDRDRCWVGDQVAVQAILRNVHDEPLSKSSVTAVLKRPNGSTQPIVLKAAPNAVRPGSYSGQLNTSMPGKYEIALPVPDSTELEVLTTAVQASIPDRERENPQRNDALLADMAEKTGGHYYVGMQSFNVSATDPNSPHNLILPQDQATFLTGTRNLDFQRRLMIWLMATIAMTLALEWTIRRIHRLA